MTQATASTEGPRVLNVRRAAEYLGVAHSTLYDLIHAGEIRTIKRGTTKQSSRFIPVAELDAWIARNTS